MTTITVNQGDALPDVLERVRQVSGEPAAVEIPPTSSLFLTASEFRALRAIAERGGIAVSVATEDPLRQQLAALFGLPVVSRSALDVGHAAESRDAPAPTAVSGAPRTSSPPSEPAGDVGEPPISDQEPPAKAAAAMHRLPGWLAMTSRLAERERRTMVIAVAALAATLAVAYLLAALFLTRATITLTVKRQPVSQDVAYALLTTSGAAPAGAAFAITATPVAFDLTVEQSIPTTGIKTVGEGVATGTIVVRNTTATDVVIEAGTRFTSFEGTDFEFVESVTIPAARGGAQPGQAEAKVRSTVPGTVGNRDLGMLTGTLRPGVYYSNRRSAVTGGTDKSIPVVAEADLAALQDQALQALVAAARNTTPGDGRMIEPGSIQPADVSYTFDHQPGEEATQLSVKATARIVALAVDAQTMRQAFAKALSTSAPAGYEIDPATIQWSATASPSSAGGQTLYHAHVEAQARAHVSASERQALAQAVAGKSPEAAMQQVSSLPYVETASIAYSPWWLPNRIPSSARHIEIVIR